MAVPKANQRAVNKYVKANYDRINVTMPKGEKEVIQGYAATAGESVNGFIVRAVRERMERDGGGAVAPGTAPDERVLVETATERPPQGAGAPTGGGGVSLLPPGILEAAQEAAEATGEAVPQFVERAVETQAKRDKSSLALGINPITGEKLKGGVEE